MPLTALGGEGGGIKPYSPFERRLAQSLYLATFDKEREKAGKTADGGAG